MLVCRCFKGNCSRVMNVTEICHKKQETKRKGYKALLKTSAVLHTTKTRHFCISNKTKQNGTDTPLLLDIKKP